MSTIWKFTIGITDEQTVEMPRGSTLLRHAEHIGDHQAWIWAIVTPKQSLVRRTIRVVGTGNPLPNPLGEHVATVRARGFVWHIFDGGEAER